jgi:midasin (ATPase involved in ribosome maturation)
MTKLGLMKGHLLVAKELLDQQKPDQAEPHIGHPVEEIYVDVEDQLQERNVKEFKTTLINLQDLVKSKPQDARVQTEYQAAMQAIDNAIQAMPAAQRQSPEFVLKVMDGLLDAAGTEYKAAIANGKIAEVIEYQDSRGFVTYANMLYKTISSEMGKENPQANQAIATSMTQLQQAWPSATAPATPTMTSEQVSGLIKSVELSTQKIVASQP